MKNLPYWHRMIKEATGCTDEDAPQVENYMLASEYRITSLSKQDYNKLAIECYQALLWSRTPEGQAYTEELKKEFYGAQYILLLWCNHYYGRFC